MIRVSFFTGTTVVSDFSTVPDIWQAEFENLTKSTHLLRKTSLAESLPALYNEPGQMSDLRRAFPEAGKGLQPHHTEKKDHRYGK